MTERADVVLNAVLKVMQPMVRLLLRHGVTYTALAAALKRVFLAAAQAELAQRGMPQTDSAITLLSGVHRRDVRTLLRTEVAQSPPPATMGPASEVVARWLQDAEFRQRDGRPRVLPRSGGAGSFEALVSQVSHDVRPRALLDELKRLGVAEEDDSGVRLCVDAFLPRQGFTEMSALLADNLHDHALAATLNLQGERDLLEQAVFVDQITAESAVKLQQAAVKAWKLAFHEVMGEAQSRFDLDEAQARPEQRIHRARFGVYFYSDREPPKP